jgi:transposase
MEIMKIKRLDHHGIVSGVIEDLKIVEIVDEHVGVNEQEKISAGMAVKSMILNGLGFTNRPLTLSPQFFENIPMEHLFGDGYTPDLFNRHKLGRVLGTIFQHDPTTLFSRLSLQAVKSQNINTDIKSLDTSTLSVHGKYKETDDLDDSEPIPITINHGYSKAKRPDLKQIVLELIVSQDGGIPLFFKTHSGNANDSVIFRERMQAIVEGMKDTENPDIFVADSKLYGKKTAEWLKQIPFVTRIPNTIKKVSESIKQAINSPDNWEIFKDGSRCQSFSIMHYDIEQRWIVIDSEKNRYRAEEAMEKMVKKEEKSFQVKLRRLKAKDFACEKDAQTAINELVKKLNYLKVSNTSVSSVIKYENPGKPTSTSKVKSIQWKCNGSFEQNEMVISQKITENACFVLGTNIPKTEYSDEDIRHIYKDQNVVEQGFRFLKEKTFFTDALFLKTPARIESLVMVMTLSLLVYSIAQKRLRDSLQKTKETIPNQINQPKSRPTMRWIFQLFEGVNLVEIYVGGKLFRQLDGMNALRQKIISHLGASVHRIYSTVQKEETVQFMV